ncbi:LAQU0S03e03884g1_1 [Lachancea quebecensis]|uniref:LAQU0S03e03884g1_1 n=1 Tax=Lachancea quebecensis TaxID=1654605 RepID=A0A0P1KRL9_9SACH|nr:LAQU0S03e03884g1_1 [Lachancea quebecensis]
MSSSQTTQSKDEGPKLREEKHFADFYPDLEQQELLPLIVINENKDDANLRSVETKDVKHIKQMIFRERVTLEPINVGANRAKFKKCKFKVSSQGINNNPRISKYYQKFGYISGSLADKFNEYETPYIKKTDSLALVKDNPLGHISRYQSNFKVEYDMDEQDELYLRFLNDSKGVTPKNKLTHEIFEIAMTALENEWFFLEKKIPPRISTTSDVSTRETRAAWAHFEAFGSDDGTGHTIDQPCAVCGGTECDNSNAIVFCDGCDVAVHQECYGVVFIPEGQWLCRRCMISRNRKINCLFCPSHTGAFKQTDTGSWGHVVCGLWIPELYFVNSHYMEPIEGVDLIPRSRWKLTCYICRKKVGACIQCSNKNCFSAYHVTCAKRSGLCMDFGSCSIIEASSNAIPPGLKLLSLCDKHSPSGWPSCEEGIKKTRLYFSSADNNGNIDSGSQPSHSHSSTKGRWTTNRGTPIAPSAFASVTQRILEIFQIENSAKVSADLCKYWSMKRELKRGAPLVRKFDPTSFSTFTVDQLGRRIEFADELSKDLEKLQDMARLLVKRQTTTRLRNKTQEKIREMYQHPSRFILQEAVVEKLQKFAPYRALLREESVNARLSAIFSDCISTDSRDEITQFKKDMAEFLNDIETDQNISRRIKLEAKKLRAHVAVLLTSVDGIDYRRRISEDFTMENGRVKAVPWKGPALMKQENLEAVKELSQAEMRKLRSLLN